VELSAVLDVLGVVHRERGVWVAHDTSIIIHKRRI
jgi:hypothetical protein